MHERGQIGKWVVFVFLAIALSGLAAFYFISSSPENYRSPAPPVLLTQTATGEFGLRSDGSFGLVRVSLIVKSIERESFDHNGLGAVLRMNQTPVDANLFSIQKVRNLVNREKTLVEKNDVLEIDLNVERALPAAGVRLEIGLTEPGRGTVLTDAIFAVPDTRDRFEKLFH